MSHVRGYPVRAGLGGIAVALLLSCKNVEDPPTPAAIGGTWQYHETMADDLFNVTCADTGTYTFTQEGGKFSGTFVQTGKCRSGGTSYFNTGHGLVTNGTVTDVRLEFTAGDLCAYAGQLSMAHDAVNEGTGLCDFVDSASARHYSLQINWSMTR